MGRPPGRAAPADPPISHQLILAFFLFFHLSLPKGLRLLCVMDGPECAARADAIPKPGPLTVDAKPDAMPPGVLGLAGPALGRRRRPETLSSSWRALSPIEPFRWACRRHDHGGGRGGVPHAITGGRSRIGWAEGGGCAAMQAEQDRARAARTAALLLI